MFFTKRSRAAINIYASHSRHAEDDTSVANTSRRWVSSGAVSCRNVHRTPYGHTPCILKLRHRTVRSPRGLFSARSSLSPWANWHLRPYGHRPSVLNTRHICVLYLSPVVIVDGMVMPSHAMAACVANFYFENENSSVIFLPKSFGKNKKLFSLRDKGLKGWCADALHD